MRNLKLTIFWRKPDEKVKYPAPVLDLQICVKFCAQI